MKVTTAAPILSFPPNKSLTKGYSNKQGVTVRISVKPQNFSSPITTYKPTQKLINEPHKKVSVPIGLRSFLVDIVFFQSGSALVRQRQKNQLTLVIRSRLMQEA